MTAAAALRARDALEAAFREIGDAAYHDRHPFHQRLNAGDCTLDELRAWALNRYCYQRAIPIKDAVVLSRLESVADRRIWRSRIVDHDGEPEDAPEGGLKRWLALTDGLGLDRSYVVSLKGVLPAVRFACDAYVAFCRERTPLEAVASSLTEMFSPKTIRARTSAMLRHYPVVSPETLRYFDSRLSEAPRDVAFALDYVEREARTAAALEAALDALRFKCAMLWSILDAIEHAYVFGRPPPGAWRPGVGLAPRGGDGDG